MGSKSSSQASNYEEKSDFKPPEEIEVDYQTDSPRFSVQNIEEIQQGIEHLNEHGYAVFSNVLTTDEAKHGVDLLWEFLEGLEAPFHIRRDDPKTWNTRWPGMPHFGLINSYGIGQSEFMWFVRGNPNVKKVFSHVWDSNELCVSFDAAGCFRNWHINPKWKTSGAWYHCDQNPIRKPNRCSIQGLVALTDNDEYTGGLVIVPKSQNHFLQLQKFTKPTSESDYVGMPYQYELLRTLTPRLIKCKTGDLIIWDSRCIHCNTPALVDKESPNQSELLRVVSYICMSPASMFVPDDFCSTIEEFREKREEYVRLGMTCTHWPLKIYESNIGLGDDKPPLKLNGFQRSLILGTNVEPEDGTEEFVY